MMSVVETTEWRALTTGVDRCWRLFGLQAGQRMYHRKPLVLPFGIHELLHLNLINLPFSLLPLLQTPPRPLDMSSRKVKLQQTTHQ